MRLTYWIARRMRLRNGSGSDAGAVIAVVGVALALVVLLLSLAVTLGFKDEIRRKLTGFDAQVTVLPLYDPASGGVDAWLAAEPALLDIVRSTLPGAELRLAIRQPGILKTEGDFHGIILHGQQLLDRGSDEPFAFEKGNIVEGEWPDFSSPEAFDAIVVSRPVASMLGLEVGDKVYSNFFIDGNIKARRHTVVGLYESYFSEYDVNVAYASPALLRRIASRDSIEAGRLDIRGIPSDRIEEASQTLYGALAQAAATGRLSGIYPVSSVERSDAAYFNWLSLLDTNVAVIFILMLCVAGFTLVSSLFILILERISDIGILRALGAGGPVVSSIFVWMALRLVGIGLIVGDIVGLSLIIIQHIFHLFPLDPAMYYLSYVPVRLAWGGFLLINIGVVIAAWLILILPARLAARIDPAKTMQYE